MILWKTAEQWRNSPSQTYTHENIATERDQGLLFRVVKKCPNAVMQMFKKGQFKTNNLASYLLEI